MSVCMSVCWCRQIWPGRVCSLEQSTVFAFISRNVCFDATNDADCDGIIGITNG